MSQGTPSSWSPSFDLCCMWNSLVAKGCFNGNAISCFVDHDSRANKAGRGRVQQLNEDVRNGCLMPLDTGHEAHCYLGVLGYRRTRQIQQTRVQIGGLYVLQASNPGAIPH